MCYVLFACLLVSLSACAGFPVVETNIADVFIYNSSDRITILPSSKELLGTLLPDALATNMLGLGYNIIDRTELIRILNEFKYSYAGIIENSDFKQLGKIASIKYFIIVNSKEFNNGDVASASIKLLDIETGKILLSTTYSQPAPGQTEYMGNHNLNTTAKYIAESINSKIKNHGISEETRQ